MLHEDGRLTGGCRRERTGWRKTVCRFLLTPDQPWDLLAEEEEPRPEREDEWAWDDGWEQGTRGGGPLCSMTILVGA